MLYYVSGMGDRGLHLYAEYLEELKKEGLI